MKNAATFKASTGGECGLFLKEIEEGKAELILFFDASAGAATKQTFEQFVRHHVESRGVGALDRRPFVTCECGETIPDSMIAKRIANGRKTVTCGGCDAVIQLADTPAVEPVGIGELQRTATATNQKSVHRTRVAAKRKVGDYDVFLSYNREDEEAVRSIYERLCERGLCPWMDRFDLVAGKPWPRQLEKQIETAKAVAVFFGVNGLGPTQAMEQMAVTTGASADRPLIPVVLETCAVEPEIPSLLKTRHAADLRLTDPDPFEFLVAGITGELPDLDD